MPHAFIWARKMGKDARHFCAKESGMRSLLMMAFFTFTTTAGATVTIERVDCPTQFEGRVQEVIKSVGPSTPFATQTVIFQNNRTIKGEVNERVPVQVLENGPIQIEEGKDYAVQLRSGRICQIESL